MEATVRIDGKDVRFKATAAVPLLYRRKFNRDLLRDMQAMAKEMRGETTETNLPVQVMTTLENLAYIMAKHADSDMVPDTPEEWLAGFSLMPVYAIFPVILDLWAGNTEGLEESKKKAERLIENLQRLSSSSAPFSLVSPLETSSC